MILEEPELKDSEDDEDDEDDEDAPRPKRKRRRRRRRELTPELEEELNASADKAFWLAVAGLFLLGIPSGFALMKAGEVKTICLEVGLEVPRRAKTARTLALVAAAFLVLAALVQVGLLLIAPFF